MTDERDSSVQDWFTRSMEDMPGQPFAWEVLARVRRRERKLRLQRYAAWCMAAIGFLLLLRGCEYGRAWHHLNPKAAAGKSARVKMPYARCSTCLPR